MIRFIHVRERNLIIMCMMDSTFSSPVFFTFLNRSRHNRAQDEKDIL